MLSLKLKIASAFCISIAAFAFISCSHLKPSEGPGPNTQTQVLAKKRIPNGNGSERGGGDAFYCKPERMGKKWYLADTYELMQSPQLKFFKSLSRLAPKTALRAAVIELLALGVEIPEHRILFHKALEHMNYLKIVEQDDIEEVDDDQLKELPASCTEKKQLAVQDIGSDIIRVHKGRYRDLSPIEKEFLLAHEVFIYSYYEFGYNLFDPSQKMSDPPPSSGPRIYDTTKIRDFLKRIASGPQFQLWTEAFKTFISAPGIRFYDLLMKIRYTDSWSAQDKFRELVPAPTEKFLSNIDFWAFRTDSMYKIIGIRNIRQIKSPVDLTGPTVVTQTFTAEIFDWLKPNDKGFQFTMVCQRPLERSDFGGRRNEMGRPAAHNDPVDTGYCKIAELFKLM